MKLFILLNAYSNEYSQHALLVLLCVLQEQQKIVYEELDATFLQPEFESMTLGDQIKNRLSKLQKQARLREENMNTILSLRARDHQNYYSTATMSDE